MKRILLIGYVLLAAMLTQSFAQDRRVSGTVTSHSDGSTMPGVQVIVKGTTIGTVTDINGKYELNVPANATLLFSFIGMTTEEIVVGDRNIINVALMQDIATLQEIVVTAFGIEREKKSIGYSIQEVGSENLTRGGNPNLGNSLQGKIAGLEVRQSSGMPGAASTILIRGARSFSSNNTPLVVIDGMPIKSNQDVFANVTGTQYTQRMLDVDPNDIETISVLKGQAAAALYGMDAFNGVIIITTKSGSTLKQGKPQVSLSLGYTMDQISRWPEFQQKYSQGSGGVFRPYNSYSWGVPIDSLPTIDTYGGNDFEVDGAYPYAGKFFHPQKREWVEPKAYNSTKDFFETGHSLNAYMNVSQNTTFGDYAIGFGNTNQVGIIPSSGMDRYTARVSANVNLTQKWKAGFNGNVADVSVDKIPGGNSGILFAVYGSPASYDLVGTPYHAPGKPYIQQSYRGGAVGENPIWATKNNIFNEATRRFFGNTYLQYKPLNWLNFKYQLSLDQYGTDMEEILQLGSSQGGQTLPTFYALPTDLERFDLRALNGGTITNRGIIYRNINSLLLGTASFNVNDDIKANIVVGNEINDRYRRVWYQEGNSFTSPGWNNMANTKTQLAEETKYLFRSGGVFANAELEYRSMVFLNITGRTDRVSSMPRGNRTFFYPSASLGFVFTELPALADNPIFPYGKIRASFAQVGQAGDYFDRYYVRANAGTSGFQTWGLEFPLGDVIGYSPSTTLYSKDLQPENTQSYEGGFDLRFFNNRVGLDYTFVYNLSNNQIFAVPMAGSTGFYEEVRNAGKMLTQGHEIMLSLVPIKANNYQWDINLNFSKLTSTVEELAEGVENIFLGGYVDPNIRASAGDTYPAIYGTRFLRDDNGNILVDEDPNSDYYGMPLAGDFGKIGEVSPDFILGMSTSFRIHFISISAFFDWKNGGEIYSGTNRLIDLYGTSKKTEDRTTPFIFDGYKADGTPNDIERGGPNDPYAYEDLYAGVLSEISEAHIYDASFLKLREVSLKIDLPRSVTSAVKLQGASINIFARNILLWAPMLNFDPETSQASGNAQGGFDYMSLPQTSSFGAGLSINF